MITEDGPKMIRVDVDENGNFCVAWIERSGIQETPPDSALRAPSRLPMLVKLPIGYTSEINLKQEALVKFLSQRLHKGLMMFIDYGYPARIYYHEDRHMGTFRCHYQQHAHDDAFFWPGLQDMTAHIDFTALGRCGIESGLQLLYYGHQGDYLLDAGIVALAQKACAEMNESDRLCHQQALQTLISPNSMGEQFKVIVFGKNLEDPMPCFYPRSDRRFDL